MNRLRRGPTSTGHAEMMERADVAQQREVVLEGLAEPDPGSTHSRSRSIPAATAASIALAEEAAHLGHHVVVRAGRPASSSARPACASGPCRRRCSATTPNIAGSAPAETSFTIDGARLDRGSRDARPCACRPMTGTSGARPRSVGSPARRGASSSSAATGRSPAGSTPRRRPGCRRRRRPAASRAPRRRPRRRSSPPSENESGVTFTMPITRVRSPERETRGRRTARRRRSAMRHRSPVPVRLPRVRLSACRCGSWPPGASARRCGTGRAPRRSRSPSRAS